MPAVTADTMTLPRLPQLPQDGAAWRPVATVITARRYFEGEGFQVRRPFPSPELSLTDPFLLLDHMGAVEYGPGEAKGAPWHPHRGFETVTYMIDGAFEHQDSTGGGGLITDGSTQWMTAGAGILHSEMPPQEMVAKGGLFHGTQLWVNLPAAQKWVEPRYQDIGARDVTLLSSEDGGALVRVIAGELAGHQGPGVTHTPITYLHATVAPGARLRLPWASEFPPATEPDQSGGKRRRSESQPVGNGYTAMAYVLSGRGFAGVDNRPLDEGQLAVFGPGDALALAAADSQPAASSGGWEILLLGGLPIREQVARYGPFVMNTKAEIIQAVEDFQAGRLGTIPAERMPHHTSADEPL